MTLEAAARSSRGTMAITYAWRAGTSIEDSDMRRSRKRTASGAVGMSPASSRNTLAGRCVNTIVRTWPMRAASRAATNCDNAASRPAAKKIAPATWTGSANRRNSHRTSKDCTTNPPPNESRLNSADSLRTMPRERASGCAGAEVSCSMAGERRA